MACGAGPDKEAGALGRPSQATTPNSIVAPDDRPVRPDPETLLLRGNRSSKATALGRLCWIEREVALARGALVGATLTVEGGAGLDPERAIGALGRMRALLAALPGEIGSPDGLPEQVQEFREHLVRGAAAAQDLVVAPGFVAASPLPTPDEFLRAVNRVLDFESFPGVHEFAAAAKADEASCPDI